VTSTLLGIAGVGAAQDLGHYERIKVPGPSLEGNLSNDDPVRDVSVYLPPGYEKNSEKRYPVMYLLHGFTRTDADWFGLSGEFFVNARTSADVAWKNGAGEMIIVMPNAFTRFAGSMYSNSVTTGNWEAYVGEDLVAYMDEHYRTLAKRESRGLVGHSMGGYGALRIGMKYPNVFSSLYALSPCCLEPAFEPPREALEEAAAVETDQDIADADFFAKAMLASSAAWSPNANNAPYYFDLPLQDGELRPDVIARWVANAPIAMVDQYAAALKTYRAIHIDAGDADMPIAGTIPQISVALDRNGIDHHAEVYEGDHLNRIAERITNQVMPMLTESLAFQ